MKYALGLTVAGALMLAAQVNQPVAETNSQPVAREAPKGPLKLSEQDKAAVIKAALDAKSHQNTPKGFTPAVGATVPKTVFIHGFKPEVLHNVPALKDYWYAYLDQEVVLVDAMQTKVVAIVPLPENVASGGGQQHHGAAEPADKSKNKDGASSTESVPAYTSPETIK